MGRGGSRRAIVAVATVVTVVAGGAGPHGPSTAAAAAARGEHHVPATATATATAVEADDRYAAAPHAHAQAPPPAQGPVEVRVTFERLLGNHATLTARFMRARLQSGADLFETAEQALVANTEEMRAAVGSVVGEEPAAAFEELWVTHVDALADYARAVADDDGAGRDAALAALADFRQRYGAFVATATGGSVPVPTAEANIGAHLDHLTGHVDAYAAGDFAAAYQLQREAYRHMFPVAGALAGGIVATAAGESPVAADPAPQQLRSHLGMLLGEHFELAVEAMRAGVTGADDFEGAAQALNGNTRDLTTALDSLFGAGVAAAFAGTWAGHTELLVRYTAALAEGDDDARRGVLDELAGLRQRLAATFSELTRGAVPVEAVAATLTGHDEQLLAQVDAYADEDYAAAYEISFEGYRHMFDVAAALAPGIEAGLLAQLPQGGPETGGGGTSGRLPAGAAPGRGPWPL